MMFSGISDEAGADIASQIKAHKELGWQGIELRLVDGKNVAGAVSDEAFETVADTVEASGLQVTCFASAIGNWSRNIRNDFQQDIDELNTAIPRMKRFGTQYIRTMSWVGEGVPEEEWRDTVIERYRELAKIAEDGDIVLAHENCTGWAGLSADNQRTLIEEVGSDHLVVLFDTGNTISHGYDHWAYYTGVKDLIGYVHIKDCFKNPDGGRSENYAYVGEGDADVKATLTDILGSGYDGIISIEPHVAAIVHQRANASGISEAEKYNSYVRYGRMLMDMIKDVHESASGSSTAL